MLWDSRSKRMLEEGSHEEMPRKDFIGKGFIEIRIKAIIERIWGFIDNF